MWKSAVILFMICCLFQACGYRFVRYGGGDKDFGNLPESIAIPMFSNATTEPNLEYLITRALRDEFIKKGVVSVVPEDRADVVMVGRVTKIYTTDVAHDAVEHTTETRIYVTVDVRCKDARTGDILWQDNQFTYYEEFVRKEDAFGDYNRRRAALEYLAEQMAQRIHDRFINRF